MAFPESALDILVELMISDVWTDISSDVYSRDEIRITRGRQNEAGQVDAGRCSLTLNNRLGKYSPRNAVGPYYGQINRNTPIRVSVREGSAFLEISDVDAGRASTPDAAALDITGDIDVRIDVRVAAWEANFAQSLIGKYTTSGNQRSWRVTVEQRRLWLTWTTDGVTLNQKFSDVLVVPPSGRMAVRVTLDVNNGASGNTVTFYTAPTMTGPWEQLGDPVVTSGTTSIFSSTAPLDVGLIQGLGLATVEGEVYSAEVYSGIDGTLVANPVFTEQDLGDTSFADDEGLTWTVASGASISNRRTRFVGEVSSWPLHWDTSGNDIYTTIEAQGILRRLGQGVAPIQSAMRREFGSPAREHVVAYWPCEDGANARLLASAQAGAAPITLSGSVTPAAYSDWAPSNPLPTFGATGLVRGRPPVYTTTTAILVRFYCHIPSAVTGTPTLFAFSTTGGTASTWKLTVDSGGDLRLYGINPDGTNLVDSTTLDFNITNRKVQIGIEVWRTGAFFLNWKLVVFDLTDGFSGEAYTGSTVGQVGRVTEIRMGETGSLEGTAFGHIAISDDTDGFGSTAAAMVGNAGETGPARIRRLADEENITTTVYGEGSEAMGFQLSSTVLELFREAEATDHGILYEARRSIAVAYRDLISLYNQAPAAELTYSTDLMPGLEPVDDDQLLRNSVSVSRIGGIAGETATLEEGPLSVQAPPDGVGTYATAVSLSLDDDDQALPQAGWLVHLGTVDEPRYPLVRLNLARNPELVDQVTELDSGDRMRILDPPTKLPGGDIDLIVQGYTETLAQFKWDVDLTCTPASPFTVAVADDDLARADTDGTTLSSSVDSDDTVLSLTTSEGPLWTTDLLDTPFDVEVGGEVMTVTQVDGLRQDRFQRTVTSGWGTADTGQSWTTTGGTASDYSVQGG